MNYLKGLGDFAKFGWVTLINFSCGSSQLIHKSSVDNLVEEEGEICGCLFCYVTGSGRVAW